MFAWILKADLWLIEKFFEPVAWRAEYYWGWNNFQCSRVILGLWPASIFALIAVRNELWTFWGVLQISFICFAAGIAYILTLQTERLVRPPFGNTDKASWFGRLTWMCLTLLPPLNFLNLGALGYTIHLYFRACSPMPPKWKEERDRAKMYKVALKATSR